MKKSIFTITLLLFSTYSQVFADSLQVEDQYDCKWINASSGEKINGEMIIKKIGETYSMRSHYGDNTSYIGTGIYSQNHRNFSMAFYNPKKTDETGVTTVEIDSKGLSHTWVWAYVNKQTIERTICIKKKGRSH